MTISAVEAKTIMYEARFQPEGAYPGAGEPWPSTCMDCGRTSSPRLTLVKNKGARCRHCRRDAAGARRRVPEAEAVAIMQAAGFEPQEPFPGAGKKWLCKCNKCDELSDPRLSTVKKGHGCAHCAGKALSDTKKTAIMLAAGLEPQEPPPPSGTPWHCLCLNCGKHVWPTLPTVRAGGRCKFCAGQAIDPAEAEEIMRRAGFEPLDDFPGVKVAWRCRCLMCKEVVSPAFQAVRKGHGCKVCAGQVITPEDAMADLREVGLMPLVDYPGVNTPWRCRCLECQRDVAPTLANIRFRKSGCRFCAGRAVDPGHAEQVMRDAGLVPQEPYPGSGARWRCLCQECGNEVTPTYSAVRNGCGCRVCNRRGIDYALPTIVYVITHSALAAVKVGIANINAKTNRLKRHQYYGWEVFDQICLPRGYEAELVEQAVLQHFRLKTGQTRHRGFLNTEQMPQRGETETFGVADVSSESLWEKVQDEISTLPAPSEVELAPTEDLRDQPLVLFNV